MNCIVIILEIIVIVSIFLLFLIGVHQWNFFFQVLYAFICDHTNWKRYRRLKKYLKTDTIPIIDILDYKGNNVGFAFIQYDNLIFVIQGDHPYLSSYYQHLIKNLLKHNNHAF